MGSGDLNEQLAGVVRELIREQRAQLAAECQARHALMTRLDALDQALDVMLAPIDTPVTAPVADLIPEPRTAGAAALPAGFDPARIAAARANGALARQLLADLEIEEGEAERPEPLEPLVTDPDPQHGPELAQLGPEFAQLGPEFAQLGPELRALAALLSADSRHSLVAVREEAQRLGLMPLDAVRQINEWAADQAAERGIHDSVIEIGEWADAVWVEPVLKEIL